MRKIIQIILLLFFSIISSWYIDLYNFASHKISVWTTRKYDNWQYRRWWSNWPSTINTYLSIWVYQYNTNNTYYTYDTTNWWSLIWHSWLPTVQNIWDYHNIIDIMWWNVNDTRNVMILYKKNWYLYIRKIYKWNESDIQVISENNIKIFINTRRVYYLWPTSDNYFSFLYINNNNNICIKWFQYTSSNIYTKCIQLNQTDIQKIDNWNYITIHWWWLWTDNYTIWIFYNNNIQKFFFRDYKNKINKTNKCNINLKLKKNVNTIKLDDYNRFMVQQFDDNTNTKTMTTITVNNCWVSDQNNVQYKSKIVYFVWWDWYDWYTFLSWWKIYNRNNYVWEYAYDISSSNWWWNTNNEAWKWQLTWLAQKFIDPVSINVDVKRQRFYCSYNTWDSMEQICQNSCDTTEWVEYCKQCNSLWLPVWAITDFANHCNININSAKTTEDTANNLIVNTYNSSWVVVYTKEDIKGCNINTNINDCSIPSIDWITDVLPFASALAWYPLCQAWNFLINFKELSKVWWRVLLILFWDVSWVDKQIMSSIWDVNYNIFFSITGNSKKNDWRFQAIIVKYMLSLIHIIDILLAIAILVYVIHRIMQKETSVWNDRNNIPEN